VKSHPQSIKGVCNGDSGGPFVVKDDKTNQYYLAGVTSYGDDDCTGKNLKNIWN